MVEIDEQTLAVACECGSVPDFTLRYLKTSGYSQTTLLHGARLKEFVRTLPSSQLKVRLEEILHKRGRFAFFFVYDYKTYQILEESDILHGRGRKRG